MKPLFSAVLVLVAAMAVQGTDSAKAQSIFLEPNNFGSVQLEALRPGFERYELSTFTFALYLSGRIPVGTGIQLRAELPYMTFKDEGSYNYWYYSSSSQGKTAIGNPYLGVDVGNANGGFQGEFGLRLPVVKDSSGAEAEGLLTDPVERMEAFIPETMPIYVGVNYRYRSGDGFAMRLRLVPVFWLYVGSGSSDPEIFALYSAQAWYEAEKVGVGAGFSGRFLATGDGEDLGERTFHQFGIFANFAFGSILPGFQVRFPLDKDLNDVLAPSYSISFGVKL